MSVRPRFRFFDLVIRNLTYRPYRNMATVFSYAIIAATLFSGQFLMNGAQQSLNAGMTRMGADIMVVPEEYGVAGETVLLTGEPTTFFFKDAGFEQIKTIPGVAKASPELYIATLVGQSCCSAPVELIAIDSENDFTIATWLKENPGIRMGKDDVIVGSDISGDIGSDLLFYGHTFRIAGRLEKTGMGLDCAVFVRLEDAYIMADESGTKAMKKLTIPKGMVSAVLVKVEPGYSSATVAEAIRSQVPGTKTLTPNGLLSSVSGQLAAVTRLLYGSTLAVTVVSIPLLGFISAMVAQERRKEISILRALGATKACVMRLMLAESFTLALIGSMIGMGAAIVLITGFLDFIAFTLKIPLVTPEPLTLLSIAGTTLLLSIGVGTVASLYPAIIIGRADPYELIRRGET